MSTLEDFVSNKENELLYQQEYTILQLTELAAKLMKEKGLSYRDLAKRLGRKKKWVKNYFIGTKHQHIRHISDIFTALGVQLTFDASGLYEEPKTPNLTELLLSVINFHNNHILHKQRQNGH